MNFKKEIAAYVNAGNVSLYHTEKLSIIMTYRRSIKEPRKMKKRTRKALKKHWISLSAREIMIHGCWNFFHNLKISDNIPGNITKDDIKMIKAVRP